MTDDAPFLRAILSAPDDDTPRLVFADWLDDTAGEKTCPACNGAAVRWKGDITLVGKDRYEVPCNTCSGSGRVSDSRHERAEFIRVQCELAATGDCSADSNLRRREGELKPFAERTWQEQVKQMMGTEWVPARELDWEFRRGFVESVACTLETFLGRTCRRCEGTGEVDVADPASGRTTGGWVGHCPACHGEGRTPGIAAALFASQPVREVRPSDREPREVPSSGLWFWARGGGSGRLTGPEELPPDLFDKLTGWVPRLEPEDHESVRWYSTRDAALAALSAALVAFGRSAAGPVTPRGVKS